MFIRANRYTRKNGEQSRSALLLQSRRIKGVSRHKTLLNLGQEFPIPKPDWPELIRTVVARLKGQPALAFENKNQDFHNAVDNIAKRLLDQGFNIYAKPPGRIGQDSSRPGHTYQLMHGGGIRTVKYMVKRA